MKNISGNRRIMGIAVAGGEAMWLGLFISSVSAPLAITVCIYLIVIGIACIYHLRVCKKELRMQYMLVGVLFIFESALYLFFGLLEKLLNNLFLSDDLQVGLIVSALIVQIVGFGLVGSILIRTFERNSS